ncbi:PhzF family phenazine biosynthesis protein [Marinilabiliaceae bacterium ANBcel2]|nr:PhzF family phenazine biosynthesis protein [Marinilabiliaceae bacterium ANBcel2]
MIDRKRIFQVDAFTDRPFKGNPAGVMVVDEVMSANDMQSIALEMNLSETAFIIPNGDDFIIRFFTPTTEVSLCGHASLASAHILYEIGIIERDSAINFKAKGGDLVIRKDNDWIVMDFPKYPLYKIDIPSYFEKIVGFKPVETYSSVDEWIVAVAAIESDVVNAKPFYESMIKHGLGNLMITAESKSFNADFIVRCFAPVSGINEDPVTGSAHCALTPLWSQKLGKLELDSYQCSKRTGNLKVKLIDDRVEIKGKAITIFEANLDIF